MAFDSRLLGGVGVLAAVVETGNFVSAAEALGLTQSGSAAPWRGSRHASISVSCSTL